MRVITVLTALMVFCMTADFGFATRVPTSPTSLSVYERIRPPLERELHEKGFQWGSPVLLRLFKEESKLEGWVKKGGRFEHFKTWDVCSWSGRLGPKLIEADGQSPEGFYRVGPKQMNPWSSYHLSFNVGFPNSYDRQLGRTGSDLMIHGRCVSIGCYAMTDPNIDEIYLLAEAALNAGQKTFPVNIYPFRMIHKNLERHKSSEWYSFWRNLQIVYLAFEKNQRLPLIRASAGQYVFSESESVAEADQ